MVSSMSRKFCAVFILMVFSYSISIAQNTTMSCVGNFNLSLNACLVEITPGMIAAGTLPQPASSYTVTLKDAHGSSLPDAFVSGEHKGQEITYTLTDNSSGNSCWGTMLIEDKIAPTIAGCESGQIDIAPGGCFSYTRLDLSMSDLAVDNCDPNPELIILDEYLAQDICDETILKTIIRTIKAVDNCGNESDPCQVTVPLQRVPFKLISETETESVFVFPKDTVIDCGLLDPDLYPENLDFNNNPDPIILSGTPYFQVNSETQYNLFPIDEMSHCKLDVVYQDSVLVRDACFTKIVRYWTVIEGCALDPIDTTLIQQITIMDLEAPEMTNVPEKLNFSTNSGSEDVCAAITPIPIPTLTDNCQADENLRLFVALCPDCFTTGGALPQVEYTGQALSLPEGLSHLIYIGTDACFNGTPPNPGLNEVRDTVEVWVEDNAPPVCEIDDKAITINNDTGEVKVKAEVFDDGSYDDCSNKVKIFGKREDDGTICPCAPEDALDRYSGFVYLGRRSGHDYYLSEDSVIGPKAFNIAVAMGGYVADFEKVTERNWVNAQVVDYLENSNTINNEFLTYTVTGPDGAGQSALGWDSNSSNGFFMGTTERLRITSYDGLSEEKRFVLEVEDLCGYSEVVRFCCLDVLDGAPVTFRTMDKWGNFNECSLTVNIQDKVAPLIQCPPDDVALCNEDISDLTIFGMPTSIDACPAVITELDPEMNISACKIGYIIRKFEITSGTGSQICEQMISVVDTFPREDIMISFPPDIYLPQDADSIGLGAADLTCFEDTVLLRPSNLTGIYAGPIFEDNRVCSDLWVGYKDDVFEVPGAGPNTCFKIVRHWIIVDDCDPEKVDTIREYDQSIIITNNDAPTIQILGDTVACSNEGPEACDYGDIDIRARFRDVDGCTAVADLQWSYYFDYDCDGITTTPITGSGNIGAADIPDTQPVGNHKIVITVTDNCNNSTTEVLDFTIELCVAPIAACQALTMPLHCFPDPPSSPLNNGGTVPLSQVDCDGDGTDDDVYVYMCSQAEWFAPIKGESYHPCPDVSVVYSFSTDTTDVERCFTCTDLKCPQEVTIFVTDEYGNVDSCVTTMTLTDPKGLCPPIQSCFIPPNVTSITLDTICIPGALPEDLSAFGITSPSIDAMCCDDPNNDISFEDVALADDANGCRRVQRTWTVFTDCGCPEMETYVQTITILNNEAPNLQCPDDLTVEVGLVENANRECGARVNLPPATADNCQTELVFTNDYFPSDTSNVGNRYFPLGVTTVTYTATNACDVTTTCTTVVTVQDTAGPTIDCVDGPITIALSNMSVTLSSSEVLDLILVSTPTDFCGVVDTLVTPPTLDCDDLDNTVPVTLEFEDSNGNTSTCMVDLIVEDGVVAMLDCPAGPINQNVDTDECYWTADTTVDSGGAGNCGVVITYTISGATTVNNGMGASIAGTQLNVGENTISYTISNDQGEVETCTFIVNVIDNDTPSLTCPDDQIRYLNILCERSIPNYRPQVIKDDNCTSSIGVLTQVPVQGTTFEGVGMQMIEVFGLTSDGDTVRCNFNVTFLDTLPPRIVCPTGSVSADLDDDCRPIVPDLREGTDNCDNLILRNGDGAGPRIYQVPRQETVWNMSSDVLIIAVDRSGNRDTCMVSLNASCPGEDNAPTFNQVLPDLSTDSSDECEATISVPFTVDYCLPPNLVYSVSATDEDGSTVVLDLVVTATGVTGTVPTGVHTITVTATDPICDLSVSDSFDVTVIATGGVPATFECKKIVKAIQDSATPSVTFDANEIVCVDGGVACDGSNPTIFGSFSNDPLDQTRTYTCGDLGDIQVTMFVFDVSDTDGDGDLDTTFREPCFAIQTVVDPSGFCQFFTSDESNVEGRIQTEDGDGIESTSVALIGSEDTQEYMTEEHGLYAFPSMPLGGAYTIQPHKEDNYTNGLSTLDIILMQKHILGIVPFDSPYKIIASDVNNSGSISAIDLVEMRKVILSIKEGFDNTPSWKMVDATYQFFDSENPLGEDYPESYSIQSLDKNMAIDFIGIKMGDVNLSAGPTNLVKAETRTSANTLDLDIQPIINGNQVTFDFSSSNFVDIEGFQFTLNFDASKLTFKDVLGSVLDMKSENLGLTKSKDGYITISYDKIGGVTTSEEELLFSIVFTHDGAQKHHMSTNSSILAAQAYSTTDVFDLTSEMRYGDADIKLYQNTPNPWQETTEISFMLPVDMNYEMRFYTVSGELLHALKEKGVGGLNTIEMQRDQLSTKGLIYYELITAHEKTTKRMILIR